MSRKKIIYDQWFKANVMLIACLLVMFLPVEKVNSAPLSKSDLDQARASLAKDYAWFNAPWIIGDSAYQNIRNSIDNAYARGQKPGAVLQRYKETAEQQPSSAQALFGYGYAVYRADTAPNEPAGYDLFQEKGKIYTLSEKFRPPHIYNWTRLMFLHWSLGSPDPKLIPVGKRLLARNPDDYEVEYGLALMANASMKPEERSLAVTYQQDLARRFPNDPRQYRLLAQIYSGNAALSHSQGEADKSIAADQKYLALAPAFRKKTEEDIRIMREYQAMWRKG